MYVYKTETQKLTINVYDKTLKRNSITLYIMVREQQN